VRLIDAGDGTAMITEVLERKNVLARRAAGGKLLEQVIVANIDQVICAVAAARPAPELDLLDRYLVATEAAGLPVLICITKTDLGDRATLAAIARMYRRIGYRVLLTSSEAGSGIDEVRSALVGQVSVLAGQSGVGKSTLLNTMQPGFGLRVRDVSRKSGTGRHTTSHLEMFGLEGGGAVVDTPGMREYEPWNVRGARLDALFPEMEALIGTCQFGMDCSHTHERDCAIKQAVATEQIARSRYQSYCRLHKTPPPAHRRERKIIRDYHTALRRQELALDEGRSDV
jgi:ribosome biogenesis GTPase